MADTLRNIGERLSGAPRIAAPPVVREAIDAVCRVHDVTIAEVLGDNHARRFAEARWEIWARLAALTTTSGKPRFNRTQLGRFLNKHHTTVIHGLRSWADMNGAGE